MARALEALAWTAFFLFAALVLGLRYWLLPDIERLRPQIVERVTAAVGRPVKIGGIEAGWDGLRPQVTLLEVRIYDADGREALALPAVENIFSWRSLVHGELRLHALRIVGPRLAVRRDAAGALHVAGLPLALGTGGAGGFAERLLGQEEIEVRGAEIEWRDERRGAPPLLLTDVNLRLRSAGARHLVGLTARPPAALGARLDLRAELDAQPMDEAQDWSGRLYAELGTTDLAGWRAWIDLPIALERGQGAVRVWASFARGELAQATADVALADVAAKLGEALPVLELTTLAGRLQARRSAQGYEIAARRLRLTAPGGAVLPPADFDLAWRVDGGAMKANALELAPLAHLAGSLPLPEELRRLALELEPRGQLADLRFEWRGALETPAGYRAQARFSGLGMRPREALPGFARLAGTVEATESGGRLTLQAHGAEIELPRVFPQPRLALDLLLAQVEWERSADAVHVRAPSISVANADLSGNAFGAYTWTGSGPGILDLSASFNRASARHLAHYLPLGTLMGETARAWLAQGVLAGEASDVHLRLRGDLARFPFVDPASGQFQVRAHLKKGLLDYANGWPRISEIEGDLAFERDRMDLAARSGALLGARLHDVRVALTGIGSNPRLQVSGAASGPTGEFLGFLAQSPLKSGAGRATEGLSASGEGRLRLKLDLPLADPGRVRLAGEYEFAGNQWLLGGALPTLEAATGRLSFTEASFALHEVRGRMFGGPVTLAGGTKSGSVLEVVARGEAQAASLAALVDHPLRRYLSGAVPYVATLGFGDTLQRVSIESSLRGLASELPPPLEKAAMDTLPLRVEFVPSEGGARERLSLSLGRVLAAEFVRRKEGGALQLQQAGLWFSPQPGQAVRLPERGVLVYGSIAALDLDRWRALGTGEGAGVPASFDLRIARLEALGKRVQRVAVRGAVDAAGWEATVDADELAGQLGYRAEGQGLLTGRLARLVVPPDSAPGKTLPASKPADLPSVDFTVERFTLRGKPLGRLELDARRNADDWRIEKLAIASPEATLRGSGSWRGGATELEFSLEAADSGRFLARLGYPGMVAGAKTRLEGSVRWQGEPATIDYPTLGGELRLAAEEGEFLEIEPGLGKLVSLMNLQALPRRITLDFRDVFSKGFRFDRIDAVSRVERGILQVREFQMRGPAAEVTMAGRTDLARETQELRVRVVPSLGGSASTVVGIVNPVVGVAAALAQAVLKNPLGQIFAHEFEVTGTWADPKVAKLAATPVPAEVPSQ